LPRPNLTSLIAGRDVNYTYDFQQFISAPSLVHEVHPH